MFKGSENTTEIEEKEESRPLNEEGKKEKCNHKYEKGYKDGYKCGFDDGDKAGYERAN